MPDQIILFSLTDLSDSPGESKPSLGSDPGAGRWMPGIRVITGFDDIKATRGIRTVQTAQKKQPIFYNPGQKSHPEGHSSVLRHE